MAVVVRLTKNKSKCMDSSSAQESGRYREMPVSGGSTVLLQYQETLNS